MIDSPGHGILITAYLFMAAFGFFFLLPTDLTIAAALEFGWKVTLYQITAGVVFIGSVRLSDILVSRIQDGGVADDV